MKLYFERLIRKYSHEYTIYHVEDGHWDGPEYIEGDTVEKSVIASVFPVTPEDVDRYEGLAVTTQDIKVFIPGNEFMPQEDDEIIVNDKTYIFEQLTDRQIHSDFVKWIALLDQDEGQGDNDG